MRNRTEQTAILTLAHLERMQSSVNGNPRYRVYFTDLTNAPTSPDADLAYGITNREYFDGPKLVTFDGRGNITYIKPVE